MSDKFHVNAKGEPGKCSAQNGGCPFGGESDHHSSPEDARKAFEQANAASTFPVKSSRKVSELSQLAKVSSDAEILMEAAENGSDRTFRNIAANPDATTEALAKAFDRSEDSATKLKLQGNRNFPVEKMDKWGLVALRNDTRRLQNLMASNNVTDEQAQVVRDHLPMMIGHVVNNSRNKVSPRVLTDLAEYDSYSLMAAIERNPNYPVMDRIAGYGENQLKIAASVSRNPDVLRAAVDAPMDPHNREMFLQAAVANPRMPADALDKMAVQATTGYTQKAIYQHPNTDSATKAALVKANSDIADLNRVENLISANREKFAELDATVTRENTHGGRARSIQFDPKKVEELGLTAADMHVYVGSIKGNRLNHAKYHEETGEFVGWID
jgi:hypothetical protein